MDDEIKKNLQEVTVLLLIQTLVGIETLVIVFNFRSRKSFWSYNIALEQLLLLRE